MNKSKWHEENKARVRELARRYREANREKCRAANRASYRKHVDRRRAESSDAYRKNRWPSHLKTKYGLTREQFEAMNAAQDGRCAICRTDEPGGRGKRFHVDHCHKTGKVRQLLCNACNHVLGCARDSAETLRAAADYLTKHRDSV